MVAEDLETRLRVGVESRLVLELGDSNLLEEGLHDAQEMAEPDVVVCDDSFDLVELGKMSGVKSLVSEDTVYREVLHGLEAAWLVCKLVKHLRADRSCMRAQNVLLGLFKTPAGSIAE